MLSNHHEKYFLVECKFSYLNTCFNVSIPALFLSEQAPFYFPGLSIMCAGLASVCIHQFSILINIIRQFLLRWKLLLPRHAEIENEPSPSLRTINLLQMSSSIYVQDKSMVIRKMNNNVSIYNSFAGGCLRSKSDNQTSTAVVDSKCFCWCIVCAPVNSSVLLSQVESLVDIHTYMYLYR